MVMLDGERVRIDDKRMIAFIPPPISSPDRDLKAFDSAHEVLLAEIRERLLEPEHLREKMDLFYEGDLPRLKLGEVFDFAIEAEGYVAVEALVGWSCGCTMPEDVFCFDSWEVVSL
jgi:hypothetical protein